LNSQAKFISGHPRIGEVSNLSKLSEAEQTSKATSPDVLARLSHLNGLYEKKYPGLRYITFVNGRSRAEIIPEMEGVLGVDHSMEPDSPLTDNMKSVDVDGVEWLGELDRAVEDIGRIAKSRVKNLTAAKGS
jgi:2-oxo-4-hydroxy-4-carboxy--5-ureidoimidazoline (OHCU) decarboxylase